MTAMWIIPLIATVFLRAVSKGGVSPGSILGTFVYMLYLCIRRILDALVSMSRLSLPEIKELPQSLLDIDTAFRLKPMEVALGFSGKKALRVDFENHHTLLAGVTGFGKTYMLISILVQLYSKGARFTDYCDVYLFDYKADGKDYLNLWKPLLAGYYSIAENSAEEAIEAIEALANGINSVESTKRILVIIDEVASISTRKKSEADHALMLLAGKLRSRGTMIIATQHPRYDIISRAITINMTRKIAVHVDDEDQAKLIFRTKPPRYLLPELPGEFTIKEPGEVALKTGVVMEPDMPGDIHRAIEIASPRTHEDSRVLFLINTISGMEAGDSLLGINKRVTEARRSGITLRQKEVSDYYQMFSDAGIVSREVRGQPYRLTCDYAEAISSFEAFLNPGQPLLGDGDEKD